MMLCPEERKDNNNKGKERVFILYEDGGGKAC